MYTLKDLYARHYSSLREVAREYRLSNRWHSSAERSVAVWQHHKEIIEIARKYGDSQAIPVLRAAYRAYFMGK